MLVPKVLLCVTLGRNWQLVLGILLAVYLSHFLLREALISPQPPTLLRGLLENALRTESHKESHRCSGLLGKAASVPWWQVEKGIWYQTVVSITWGFHLEFRNTCFRGADTPKYILRHFSPAHA